MDGFIYLIGEEGYTDMYKIGMTRKKNIEERLKELQTGNGNKLVLIKSFKTKYPFKLEKMLHSLYRNYRETGEWFKLNDDIVYNFLNECEIYEKNCEILQDNPFFNKKASA